MTKLITNQNSVCSQSFTNEIKNITTKLDKNVKFVLKNTGKEYHIAKNCQMFFEYDKICDKIVRYVG